MMLKTELCRYHYDALDQLAEREPAGQVKLQRFYRHEHLTTELQGQASQSVFQHDQHLLALQLRQGGVRNSQLLTTDQQRSVLQTTEPGGSVRQVYTAYGHRRAESGLGSLLGFNGEAVDRVTGHYLLGNGHRAFNPVLMRFNSPDRLSPFGRGGWNVYAYCQGDPVNFTDPTGQFSRLISSLLGVLNARMVLKPAIPYKLARDALQWGAAGQLPGKVTLGATASVVVGVTLMVSAVSGVGAAVAAINKDTEAAAIFGFISLGLGALTLSARVGSSWAARDPKTIPTLKSFVERHKPVATTGETPPVSPSHLSDLPNFSYRASAHDRNPDTSAKKIRHSI
ncbi:RHS repeat-associated core domain-containing protein [Pseudomonas sp. G(2018)]|uniref:RHS repeat-associated core domain-containing protein n=1 Tax=Pseudomonas sp. G(2018) TaxID=2502242 RepID=UPI0010FA489E|nr:RHS repeat-associated core domain-containing protein [Pseudomonas sp. G(2018)]